MSEDRFRFPDFFTLRVKIKVIRSREWIRYVVEILRFDDQAFVAKVSDALNLKRTFELIKEQTSNRRKNLIFFPNKEDLMKRILEGLPRQTACDLTLLEQTIEQIVVQKQEGLNFCFKNGRSILIPKKEGR